MDNKAKAANLMDYNFKRHGGRKTHFVSGILIFLFALAGIVIVTFTLIKAGVSKSQERKEAEINSYNSFLIPVCAVVPSAFDDISAANMSELIEISVWSIIGSDEEPDKYDYSSGKLAIPQTDVETAFTNYFGDSVTITHQTVEGYGFRFEYSEDDSCYYIPLTGITPEYTPNVISVEEKDGLKTITCGMLYSGAWQQDYSTGKMVVPDPDKYITVSIRTKSSGSFISSIGYLGNLSQ